MVATQTPSVNSGWLAPDFTLPDAHGTPHALAGIAGARGMLVMFICNHCPYVRAISRRLAEDIALLQADGIGAIAVMSNDVTISPGDSIDKMADFAAQNGFPFPYVFDETQDVARAYGAVCTPDFFGFDAARELRYRGRFDASGSSPAAAGTRPELLEAMRQIANTGEAPTTQAPSVGCSIKWRS